MICEKMTKKLKIKFFKGLPLRKVIFPLLFYQVKSLKTVHSPLDQRHKQQSTGSKKLRQIGKRFATGNFSANLPNEVLSDMDQSLDPSGHIAAPMVMTKWDC